MKWAELPDGSQECTFNVTVKAVKAEWSQNMEDLEFQSEEFQFDE